MQQDALGDQNPELPPSSNFVSVLVIPSAIFDSATNGQIDEMQLSKLEAMTSQYQANNQNEESPGKSNGIKDVIVKSCSAFVNKFLSYVGFESGGENNRSEISRATSNMTEEEQDSVGIYVTEVPLEPEKYIDPQPRPYTINGGIQDRGGEFGAYNNGPVIDEDPQNEYGEYGYGAMGSVINVSTGIIHNEDPCKSTNFSNFVVILIF